ncbi:MAG: prolipoprotein diacylglyceryl transferase family protein, partial [Myxococcota bacterium]|nr:prolipoprotein diacylglyceryl transferase family protein [Myxococcota bacterium]
DLALFVFLWRARKTDWARGRLFPMYLASYASDRFLAEFFRGDSPRPEWGLKPIQVLLLAAAIWYGVRLWRGVYKRPEAGADAPASAV